MFGWILAGLAQLVAIAFLLDSALPVYGSEVAGEYLTDVWTGDDGLPDSSVTAIAQTPDGYLWIGTYNGLVRFDGVRFVTFDPANTPELLHARVRGLFVDAQGTLWINTYEGSLTTVRDGIFKLERRNTRLSEAEWTLVSSTTNQVIFLTSRGGVFRKLLTGTDETEWESLTPSSRGLGALSCEDGTGTLWYVDVSGDLWRLADENFERVPDTTGLAGQTINCLVTDHQGRLWVGTDEGIAIWNRAQFEAATPTNAETSVKVTSLFVTSDNHLWAVANGQLREAEGRQWLPDTVPRKDIFGADLSQLKGQTERQGGIWFFNYGQGLLHISANGESQQLTAKDGFPSEHLNCLFEDREGNCWAGMDAAGLVRVRERRFRTVDMGEVGDVAKSVCEDNSGVIWIGTAGGGLERWQAGLYTNFTLPDGVTGDSVYSACANTNGQLWASGGDEDLFVGTTNGGFHRVSPAVHGVKAIFADAEGRVWVGTRSGLYRAAKPGNEFHFFNGMPKHYVRALAEDDKGILWAGTGNGELYRISNDTATLFQPADNQESGAIWSLLAEPDGTVWIGTFRGGLLRFRDGKFTRYGKKEGLPDNVISQILDDGKGNLWLGSHQGIFSVAKSMLNDFAAAKSNSVTCLLYGRSDGLPALECSGGYQPAEWHGRDGRLWFTTVKGAVSVAPEKIQSNLLPPPVVIEEVSADGQSLEISPKAKEKPRAIYDREKKFLEVPPGKHQFEFRYTGLSLVSSDRVHFRYRLEGADADWVEAGTRRSVQYNLLPPGTYRFQVIACNSDGIWNESGDSLTLKILPFFYETLWFRILAGIIACGLCAGVVWYYVSRRLHRKLEHIARQQAVERERARIAKDIHDDLGANLTLIARLGDLAKQGRTDERVEKMANTARQAVKSLDEIVWAVNPRNDTLAHLIDYTGQFAADYLRAAGVRCLLDVPEHAPSREVPTNVRHNIFLVVKEALQNIVKHARATEVWLRVHVTNQGLRIVIEDNGSGFERAPENSLADGLRNMDQRMKELGGKCRINSHVGAGTEIVVELPWSPG